MELKIKFKKNKKNVIIILIIQDYSFDDDINGKIILFNGINIAQSFVNTFQIYNNL